jgi:hypothetical protein
MKKITVLLLVINITTVVFSQNQAGDSTRIFKYKNMLGVDATGLLGALWNNYSNPPSQISVTEEFLKNRLCCLMWVVIHIHQKKTCTILFLTGVQTLASHLTFQQALSGIKRSLKSLF